MTLISHFLSKIQIKIWTEPPAYKTEIKKGKVFKNEIQKLSYLELDDVLQGLGVLEVLLRGLVCVTDVDVVLVEVEVTSYRFVVNRFRLT